MSDYRTIRKVIKSRPTIEGAGVHLHRAIGFHEPELFDPFLLLDDFRSDVPAEYLKGFPWHPHRGIETITYVLRGDVEHGDSLGNSGVISSGDVQWMTAGNGIIHQEMPKGDSQGSMHGFQLWANLPRTHKMMDPRYRGLAGAEIPEITQAGGTRIKIIAGKADEGRGCGLRRRHRSRVPRRDGPGGRRLHAPDAARPHGFRLCHRRQGRLLPSERSLHLRSRRGQLLRHGAGVADR
jgi:redox-sensitive bicupin YhaK (pirin superfamily)